MKSDGTVPPVPGGVARPGGGRVERGAVNEREVNMGTNWPPVPPGFSAEKLVVY